MARIPVTRYMRSKTYRGWSRTASKRGRAAAVRMGRNITQRINTNTARIRQILQNEEVKTHDVTINQSVAIAGNAYQSEYLSGLTVGNTAITRVGNFVNYKSVAGKFNVIAGPGEVEGLVYRYMLVLDLKPNGAAVDWVDVCTAATNISMYNVANTKQKRFKILCDKLYTMDSAQFKRTHKFYYNLEDMRGDYSLGNAGTEADQNYGTLTLLVNASNNTTAVAFGGFARLRYTDS